jgi:hypothetical protein
MRWFVYLLGILGPALSLAEDELPQDPEEPMEIEPPLLIQPNQKLEPLPASSASNNPAEPNPEQIEAALDKAKKSAAAGERLFRSGIISKLDSENRTLKVARLEADLANAVVLKKKQEVVSLQNRADAGEVSQAELERAKSALAAASNEAVTAVEHHNKAELDEALLNVRRQKKLLALGSGRKADVSRAEEKAATLQQQQGQVQPKQP